MKVADFCVARAVTIEAQQSLRHAALLMRNGNVGALVVVEVAGGVPRPVGMLTDRDIVVAVLAPGARLEDIRAGEAMSRPLALAHEEDGIFELAQLMREKAVRRLPVVARDGALRGMVTLDDLLQVISAEVAALSEALTWQRRQERAARKPL